MWDLITDSPLIEILEREEREKSPAPSGNGNRTWDLSIRRLMYYHHGPNRQINYILEFVEYSGFILSLKIQTLVVVFTSFHVFNGLVLGLRQFFFEKHC